MRDKRAARDSMRLVLAWEFERIVVGHGSIIESGDREVLRSAWSWLGD